MCDVSYLVIVYIQREEKTNRRYWIHPFISFWLNEGDFHTLFSDFENDDKFFNYFRMSIQWNCCLYWRIVCKKQTQRWDCVIYPSPQIFCSKLSARVNRTRLFTCDSSTSSWISSEINRVENKGKCGGPEKRIPRGQWPAAPCLSAGKPHRFPSAEIPLLWTRP